VFSARSEYGAKVEQGYSDGIPPRKPQKRRGIENAPVSRFYSIPIRYSFQYNIAKYEIDGMSKGTGVITVPWKVLYWEGGNSEQLLSKLEQINFGEIDNGWEKGETMIRFSIELCKVLGSKFRDRVWDLITGVIC
jgi:hypothetical protein